jgi:hypothetical protein
MPWEFEPHDCLLLVHLHEDSLIYPIKYVHIIRAYHRWGVMTSWISYYFGAGVSTSTGEDLLFLDAKPQPSDRHPASIQSVSRYCPAAASKMCLLIPTSGHKRSPRVNVHVEIMGRSVVGLSNTAHCRISAANCHVFATATWHPMRKMD